MAQAFKHPLVAFRDANGQLSQAQAAELVGITQEMWSRLESGRFFASPTVAKRIADLTGMDIVRLLNFGDNRSETPAESAQPESVQNLKDMP